MENALREKLISLSDSKYAEFSKKLVTTKYELLGVRVPTLRKLSLGLAEFEISERSSFEEIFLYGLNIAKLKNSKLVIEKLNYYLNFVDNWSICDMVASSLKIVKKNKEEFFAFCTTLLKSGETYRMRMAIVIFLTYFRESKEMERVYSLFPIQNNDYYFLMAVAWLNATYLIFNEELVLKNLSLSKFNKFVINKSISKARESYRIGKETKELLKGYRV